MTDHGNSQSQRAGAPEKPSADGAQINGDGRMNGESSLDASSVRPPLFDPSAPVDADAADAIGAAAPVDAIQAALDDAVRRTDIDSDEMMVVPVVDRVAVLVDAPRSELLRAIAERAQRMPEEIVIEALDRFFDRTS